MEDLILLDSSVLIDYYSKTQKDKSFFFHLSNQFSGYNISVITEYETLLGGNELFWKNLFLDFTIITYSSAINSYALKIQQDPKKKRKSIDFRDLIIAATVFRFSLPLATINKKHFENIDSLQLITPKDFGL
ncbi:type II toxin-antitoxin system VapC family toxin [soil metagenome]